jgi:hypothetical protein
MSIYALRGQAAYDRSREEPADDPYDELRTQLDKAADGVQAAQRSIDQGRVVECMGWIEDVRAMLNGIETGSRVRLS